MDCIGKTVPACSCLVFTHNGSMTGIGESYRDIYMKWLPQSDRRPTLPFNFERYFDGQSDPYSEECSMQICVPVQ
jgi:predicted transcriptional regulator YdeE